MAFFNEHKIRDDVISVFRLIENGSWYMRCSIPGKGQVTRSLRTKSDNECDQAALELYIELTTKVKIGAQISRLTFNTLWDAFIKNQQRKVDAGLASANVQKQLNYSGKFFLKHFDKADPTKITEDDVEEFKIWRKVHVKDLPGQASHISSTTMNIHINHLRQFFRWLNTSKQLKLRIDPRDIKSVKRDNNKRPAFTNEQFSHLCEFLQNRIHFTKYTKDGVTGEIPQEPGSQREYNAALLYYFVRVLTATGMRPGELLNIRWAEMSVMKDDDKRDTIRFHVEKSKTQESSGRRDVVGRSITYTLIEAWKKFALHKKPNDYIFASWTGEEATHMGSNFADQLEAYGLTHTSDGRPYSLYSCRHTYATLTLRYSKINPYLVAANMGTGVENLKKHYGQITPLDVATQLGGKGLEGTDSSWGDFTAMELVGIREGTPRPHTGSRTFAVKKDGK